MIGEAPEAHQDKIDRQERRDKMRGAAAKERELKEKLGTTTVTMYESEREENEVEVEKPECKCGGGIAVLIKPNKYPSVRGKCLDCGKTYK